jgi:hypothetical protein
VLREMRRVMLREMLRLMLRWLLRLVPTDVLREMLRLLPTVVLRMLPRMVLPVLRTLVLRQVPTMFANRGAKRMLTTVRPVLLTLLRTVHDHGHDREQSTPGSCHTFRPGDKWR